MSGKPYIRASVLAALLDKGTATRKELVEHIGCGNSSLYTAVLALAQEGLVQDAPPELRTDHLAVVGLTKAGIDAALAVNEKEVEHA